MLPAHAIRVALATVTATALLTGCGAGGTTSSPSSAAGPGPSSSAVAAATGPCGRRAQPLRHVVWVVLENHAYDQVIGSADAPYINGLAASCGLATRFTAEGHPSLPNYIAMTSGSTQGITDDDGPGAHRLAVPSIFSQLGARWRAWQESMPGACALSDSGNYAVRHNPAVYYTGVRRACTAQDRTLRGGASPSAAFTFVTPNLCHDMHSCSVRAGDRWLAGWLPGLLRSRAYRSGSTVVFVTWDEDDGSAGQHIPTLVLSPGTRRGTRSATPFNHYSLLRTTEEILGVPGRLGAAAGATSMRSAFGLG
jgi:hypothetical protein